MAKIQTREPEQIVSPAVGVPQLDTSGQQIGQELSHSAESMADIRFARDQMVNQITARNAANTLDQQARSTRNQVNKSFYDAKDENGNPIIATPEQQQAEVIRQIQSQRDALAKTMTTPGQRNAFAMASSEVLKSHQDASYNDGLARQTQQVHSAAMGAVNSTSQQVYDVFSDPNLTTAQKNEELSKPGGIQDRTLQTLQMAQKFLPADEFHKLQEMTARSHATSAIMGAIQADPNEAIEMLKKNGFADPYLTPQDKVYLERTAYQAIERNQKEAAINLSYNQNQSVQNLWTGIHAGTARLADIQQARSNGLIGQPDQKALTDLMFSKKALDPSEKDEVFNNLVEEQGKLFDQKGNPTKEATLQSMALLRQHVIEAERVGAISTSKAQTFYRATTPTLDEKALDEMKQSVLNRKSGFDFFGHWIGNYKIGTDEEQGKAKAELTHTLAKQIDDMEASGQQVTATDVKGMAQTILKNYITKNYPETMNAKDTPHDIITAQNGPTPLHSMPIQTQQGGQKVSAGAGPAEGQTATNPKTNEKMVFKGGKWQKI